MTSEHSGARQLAAALFDWEARRLEELDLVASYLPWIRDGIARVRREDHPIPGAEAAEPWNASKPRNG